MKRYKMNTDVIANICDHLFLLICDHLRNITLIYFTEHYIKEYRNSREIIEQGIKAELYILCGGGFRC